MISSRIKVTSRAQWNASAARDPASGLLDEEGYFYRNQDLRRSLDPEAARIEMEAQVDRAPAAGLGLTHVDCHMFSMLAGWLVGH